jgi:hypothetical protein
MDLDNIDYYYEVLNNMKNEMKRDYENLYYKKIRRHNPNYKNYQKDKQQQIRKIKKDVIKSKLQPYIDSKQIVKLYFYNLIIEI